jgi:hypothetical protein
VDLESTENRFHPEECCYIRSFQNDFHTGKKAEHLKAIYEAPTLTRYGSVVSLTMGMSGSDGHGNEHYQYNRETTWAPVYTKTQSPWHPW